MNTNQLKSNKNFSPKSSGFSKIRSGIFLILFAFALQVQAQKAVPELKWTGNLKCFLESSATVADINNDGRDEAVVASQEELIAVGKDGKVLWHWRTKGRFMTYPAILKRAGQPALIYAGDGSGQLSCLDGSGKVVWQAMLNAGTEWSAGVLADLNGDGKTELIQTDVKGTVWIFDALTGKVLNKTSVGNQPVSPAVGDLNGDGKPEIALATNDGSVTVLDKNLALLWKKKIGGFTESWSTSAPVMFSASDGRNYLVAASGSGEIFCFDADGNTVWNYPTKVPVASSVSVGDFDLDGQADIFLVTQSGLIYRFDEHGNVIWKIDMQGRSLAPGAIADINGDGKPEYILSTQQGHFLILNQNGDIIFDRQMPSRTINVTPSLGHINGNAQKTDLFMTGGEAGLAYCFETSVPVNSLEQWTSYRCNIQNTGSWFGLTKSDRIRMIPQNLGWNRVLAGGQIQFNIYNPSPDSRPLKASAYCLCPDGSKSSAVVDVQGKLGQLFLPVDVTQPGDYQFNWKLKSQDGKTLLEGSREINIKPFANDQALAEQAVNTLNASAQTVSEELPLSALALKKEAFTIETEASRVAVLQKRVPESDAIHVQATVDATSKLNTQAQRALKISSAVEKAAGQGKSTSLIAFEGTVWENRNVEKQIPEKAENPLSIRHRVVRGEHQPVPLDVFNVTDHTLNVRIVPDNPDTAIHVRFLHSINVPTSLGEESWDALPEMDESGIISVPSLASREIWLDIETGEAVTGRHELNFTLQALNGAGVLDAPTNPHDVQAPETKVRISLDILPFKMAPSGTIRMCTWSPSEGPEINDLLAHGNNVFVISQPRLNYDEKNEISEINYKDFDRITSRFSGKDVFFLITGIPGIKAEFGSDLYKKQLEIYLKDLVSHLSGNGIDTKHFALYPFDEPGGNGWNVVNQLVKFAGMVKAVNPDILMYVDGGGELPMFQAMSKYLDIWSPSFDWLADKNPVMDIMHTTGKALWSYNCSYGSSRPVGPNTKNINLFYEYRTAALFAIRNGASGIGFWCYNLTNENMWSRAKMEYNLIYPGITGPVTSRRWEAVREGIEDARIVAALQEYLKPGSKVDKSVREKIEHLVLVSLPGLVDPAAQAVKIGQSREVFDLLGNDAKMNDFRNEMLDCIQALIESKPELQGRNWAEKLGFPSGKKVLLLHMDDAGMCPEANTAVENYIGNRQINSTAVMMPCPNAKAMIDWAKDHPAADIGIHLTLTSEWETYRWGPVSNSSKVPGLIDPDGKLWHEVPDVVQHASSKEVETEIRAQIDQAMNWGYRPSHIDTHMGTLYGSPEYVKVFLKTAEEYRLPANAIDLSDPQVVKYFKKAGYPITNEVINMMGKYQLPKLDNFTSVPEGKTYDEKRENFFSLVKSLNPGLTEIIFHPSVETENLKTITHSWQQRVWESQLFADPVVQKFLKDEGIIITDWKEIMKRYDEKEEEN